MSDTTSRDQLAQIIEKDFYDGRSGWLSQEDEQRAIRRMAEAIIAAGWRPPARVVTTVEELDALAVGTVIMEGDHGTPDDTGWGFKTMPGVFHRFPDGWHVVAGIGEHAPDLPATVLWEPEEGE